MPSTAILDEIFQENARLKDRVEALERENSVLKGQLIETQASLGRLYMTSKQQEEPPKHVENLSTRPQQPPSLTRARSTSPDIVEIPEPPRKKQKQREFSKSPSSSPEIVEIPQLPHKKQKQRETSTTTTLATTQKQIRLPVGASNAIRSPDPSRAAVATTMGGDEEEEHDDNLSSLNEEEKADESGGDYDGPRPLQVKGNIPCGSPIQPIQLPKGRIGSPIGRPYIDRGKSKKKEVVNKDGMGEDAIIVNPRVAPNQSLLKGPKVSKRKRPNLDDLPKCEECIKKGTKCAITGTRDPKRTACDVCCYRRIRCVRPDALPPVPGPPPKCEECIKKGTKCVITGTRDPKRTACDVCCNKRIRCVRPDALPPVPGPAPRTPEAAPIPRKYTHASSRLSSSSSHSKFTNRHSTSAAGIITAVPSHAQ